MKAIGIADKLLWADTGRIPSQRFIDISPPDGALLLCGGEGIDSQNGESGACVLALPRENTSTSNGIS